MPAKYKLIYFDVKGKAEVIRLMLASANVDYEDVRLDKEHQWPEYKPKTPFGQVPVLEVDGKMIAQSAAITRFIAHKHGLAGVNDLEAARIDMLFEGINDVMPHVRPASMLFRKKEIEEAKALLKKIYEEHLKKFLNNYSKFLKEEGTGFLVGKKVSYTDIGLLYFLSNLHENDESILNSHEDLLAYKARIENLPGVKEWIEKRPKTTM